MKAFFSDSILSEEHGLVSVPRNGLDSCVPVWGIPGEGNGNPLQYSCLENPWMEEPGRLQYMVSQRVGHDLMTSVGELRLHKLHRKKKEKEKANDLQLFAFTIKSSLDKLLPTCFFPMI